MNNTASMTRRMVTGILAAAALATMSRAAEPVTTVAGDAESLVADVAKAYGQLKSTTWLGRVAIDADAAGEQIKREDEFTGGVGSAGEFFMESKGVGRVGWTGSKLFAFDIRRKAYKQADQTAPADGKRLTVEALPRVVAGRINSDIALAIALSEDPAKAVVAKASKVTRAPDVTIDGAAYPALAMELREGGSVVMAVDGTTHLIRRVTMDNRGALEKNGIPDVKKMDVVIDYTTQPATDGAFAFTPPEGASFKGAFDEPKPTAAGGAGEAAPAEAMVGKPAPDWTLKDLDGNDVKLSSLKGQVVVMDFWATWCGPCRAALPHYDKINAELAGKGLKFYAVNLRESKELASGYMKKTGLGLPVVLDLEGKVGELYNVTGIPQTVLIGKDGIVKKVHIGFDADEVAAFKALIEKEL